MSENNDALAIKLRKKLNKSIAEENSGKKLDQKPKIQKVPSSLRGQENSEKFYEPKWMSIGPIHHGNPKFKLAEDYKFALAAKFIRERRYQTCEELYDSIKNNMVGLEECFSDEAIEGYEGEFLNWVLFFDGCAILQFVHSYSGGDSGSELKELKMKNDQVAFTQHDIFLLENQIPFRVLKLLMESRKEDEQKLKRSMLAFIGMNAMAPPKYQRYLKAEMIDQEPDHLLDLLLSVVVGKERKMRKSQLTNPVPVSVDDHGMAIPEGSSSVINIQESNDKHEEKNSDIEQQSFRSVTDLKVAGINLKSSATSTLTDVHFSSLGFVGTLQLPPLIVDDLTGSRFMNLIAYEMCPDNTKTGYEVTSYISFLDSLIDYPTDVKELRSAQILHNFLGCDKDVARLFNKIGTDLVPNPKVYERVIEEIEKHYKKRLVTWMAQVYNDHFSSPWTIVTFLAAVLALGLAIIDTLLNVEDKMRKK